MMTRGRGVFWPMMTSSQEPQFLGFFKEFFQNFPKNLQNLDKNFQLSEEILTKINVILFLWHHIRG